VAGWTDRGRLAALVLVALLGACSNGAPDAVLDDYLTRVARVVDEPAALPPAELQPAYPQPRALAVPIPRRTIDVAEFIQLHGCDMGALVAARNSPLGRLQTPSQRLGYEAAWLAALDRCRGAAEWTQALAADKRALLPALFWNATFAAAEMRVALGAASASGGDDLADLLHSLGDAFAALERGAFDLSAIETTLARLRAGSHAGPARARWAAWRRHFSAVAMLVGDAGPRLCLNGQPTPRARRLQTVFTTFYVEQIQPALALDMRRDRAWIDALGRLLARLGDTPPPAFLDWYRSTLSPTSALSEWRRTQVAVVDHARAWQALFADCGIEPGAGVGQH
jgi:hypothetical protein